VNSDILLSELAGLIRRMERRISTDPKYADVLAWGSQEEAEHLVLNGLEDAIAGLALLHIQTRKRFGG
jgi:hypothetical protein